MADGISMLVLNNFNMIDSTGSNFYFILIYFKYLDGFEEMYKQEPKYIITSCSDSTTQAYVTEYRFQWREKRVATYAGVPISLTTTSTSGGDRFKDYMDSALAGMVDDRLCSGEQLLTWPNPTNYIDGVSGGRFDFKLQARTGYTQVTGIDTSARQYRFISEIKRGITSPYYIWTSGPPYNSHGVELDIAPASTNFGLLHCEAPDSGAYNAPNNKNKNFTGYYTGTYWWAQEFYNSPPNKVKPIWSLKT